jgi:hypothetical protein
VSEKVENPNRALDQVLVESAQKGDKKAFLDFWLKNTIEN